MDREQLERALCRRYDPELWFPVGTTGPAVTQAAEAKEICNACPIERACLEEALTRGYDSGIFGGKDEEERRTLLRRGGIRALVPA